MKTLLILALLLCATQTQAQPDYSKLPTLPVWYELNDTGYGQAMTYLPNFDTARKGFNALTQYQGSGKQNGTWYNRFRGDTENMYTWYKPFLSLYEGDFNGDNVRDFMSAAGREIYIGSADGSLPDTVPILRPPLDHNSARPSIIADFNNDGKDDALIRASSTPEKSSVLGSILLGNADLTKMQVIPLPHTYDSTECIIDAYAKGDGTGRMVTASVNDWNPQDGKLALWKLRFDTAGGTTKPVYSLITSITLTGQAQPASGVFTHHQPDEHILTRFRNVYRLDNDRFDFLGSRPHSHLQSFLYALNSVSRPGYIGIGNFGNPDVNNRPGLFFAGSPVSDTIPFAKIQLYDKKGDDNIYWTNMSDVGDVNGDGAADVAVRYGGVKNNNSYSRFVIYLGIPGAVGVSEVAETLTAMDIHVSNPVRRGAPLRLTMRTQKTARLELYALGGGRIAELWRGTTDGETRTVEAALPALAPGMYNLRLTDGRAALDKALLITE